MVQSCPGSSGNPGVGYKKGAISIAPFSCPSFGGRLPNKGIEHPGKGARELHRSTQHGECYTVLATNRYGLVFVLIVQDHEIPLVKHPFLVCKRTLKDDGRFLAAMRVGRRFAAGSEFLEYNLFFLTGEPVGDVQDAHITQLALPRQAVEIFTQ